MVPCCCGRISIHAPRVGSDTICTASSVSGHISIHAPRVGSDLWRCKCDCGNENFNPRSPCGERLLGGLRGCPVEGFQSTLPVWGATHTPLSRVIFASYFNPRSPCGERPGPWTTQTPTVPISIHAPRVGSDPRTLWPLRGGTQFQSTLPVWGATFAFAQLIGGQQISIHAPRVGSDLMAATPSA